MEAVTTPDPRRYLIDPEGKGTPCTPVTWDELAAVNEPETMEEIATLAVGQETVLGMADPIRRTA